MLGFLFKQKTADEMRISDWSSDVCSSDLDRINDRRIGLELHADREAVGIDAGDGAALGGNAGFLFDDRGECDRLVAVLGRGARRAFRPQPGERLDRKSGV